VCGALDGAVNISGPTGELDVTPTLSDGRDTTKTVETTCTPSGIPRRCCDFEGVTELEPEVKVPGLDCDRSLPEGVPFMNNMGIEEPEYGIFFTNVFGDQAFQRWNDIHKVGVDSHVSYLVMASMIKTQGNARFSLKLRKLIAEHPNQEKLKSKRVKLEALGYKLD
ncbi:hypothetical protein Tco_0456368, partial [Tanacetum coccineum]